jgi:hypothetical protein
MKDISQEKPSAKSAARADKMPWWSAERRDVSDRKEA